MYAGFGDGLPFVPWIGMHIRRKGLLDLDDMRAIARLGAWECLRSGMTTIGDCSFSGAAAEAAAETGLAAVVFLEVFGATPDAETALPRFEELRERIAPALSDRVRLGISPHAPYTCSVELYAACAALGLPVQTHLAESPAERRVARRGHGRLDAAGRLPHPTGRGDRGQAAGRRRAARPARGRRPIASTSTRRRSPCSPSTGSGWRTVRARTATSAADSLRYPSSAPRASRSRSRRTAPPRHRRSTSSRRSARRSWPRGPVRSVPMP